MVMTPTNCALQSSGTRPATRQSGVVSPKYMSHVMQMIDELPRQAAEQEEQCKELADRLAHLQQEQQQTEERIERAVKVCTAAVECICLLHVGCMLLAACAEI